MNHYNSKHPAGRRHNPYNYTTRVIDGMRYVMPQTRYVWSKHFGEIPRGYHVHHIDGNPKHNRIGNLRCMSDSDHKRLHGYASKWKDAFCDCGEPVIAKGLCRKCYNTQYRANH